MSDSYRDPGFKTLGLVGIALLLVAAWSLFLWNISQDHFHYTYVAEQQATKYGPAREYESKDSCAAISKVGDVVDCVVQKLAASRETQRREQDLSAQKDMARWAFWVVFISGFQLIVSLIGAVLLIQTLQLTMDNTKAALASNKNTVKAIDQEQANAQRQLRAYLHPILPKLHTVMIGHKAFALVNVKNFGQTPAYDVKSVINFDILPSEFGFSKDAKDIPDISIGISASPMPPSEAINQEIFSARVISETEMLQILGGSHALFVAGFIQYRDAFGMKRETEYRFMATPGSDGLVTSLQICAEGNWAT